MERISALGVDLAKRVFAVHGVNEKGAPVLRRKYSRSGLSEFMAKLRPCMVGMEACGGARYWAREFRRYGHTVRLIPAQYVKPFVKTNKNDANDAEAIVEALQRPGMRFVADKSPEQQRVQALHRIRQRRIRSRTKLINEFRATLAESGFIAPVGAAKLRERVTTLLTEADGEPLRGWAEELLEEWRQLDEWIARSDGQLRQVYRADERCQRLGTIPGIGELTATALVATVGDITAFHSGRHLAAWLGLVPRQHSSGGKTTLMGISKRGDRYLRTLLIHGARSVARQAAKKTDRRSRWLVDKIRTRGMNRATVALANKNARVAWKLLSTQQTYQQRA